MDTNSSCEVYRIDGPNKGGDLFVEGEISSKTLVQAENIRKVSLSALRLSSRTDGASREEYNPS
jgi:hypothetical protein